MKIQVKIKPNSKQQKIEEDLDSIDENDKATAHSFKAWKNKRGSS